MAPRDFLIIILSWGSKSHVVLLLKLGGDVVHVEGVVHLLQGLLVLLDQVQVVVGVYHQLGIVLWILSVLLIIVFIIGV